MDIWCTQEPENSWYVATKGSLWVKITWSKRRDKMSNLTDKEREILDGRNFVFIATLNPDGSPHVSPVWAERDGDLVVINTDRRRVKAKNMARDNRVALSAYDQANPYDKIIIRGEVVEMIDDGAPEHIDKLSQKYGGKPFTHQADEQRVIVKIRKK
jgi:PPOX class probable F420-dependent enzyme